MQNRRTTIILGLVIGMIATPAVHAAHFIGLGDLPGGEYFSNAWAISSDGTTVVGGSRTERGREAYQWTPDMGSEGLGYLAEDNVTSFAYGVSSDGSVVVGFAAWEDWLAPPFKYTEAFRWTESDGMIGLGDLPGGIYGSSARAVSDDGSVIVGASIDREGWQHQAFRWTEQNGMKGLDVTQGLGDEFPWLDNDHNISSWALAVSGDGSTVAGATSGRVGSTPEMGGGTEVSVAWRWTEETGVVPIGGLSGATGTSVFNMTPDGSVMVGESGHEGNLISGATQPFVWREETGVVDLAGWNHDVFGSSWGISDDGSVIIGESWTDVDRSDRRPFIWTADSGVRDLPEVLLTDYGLGDAFAGWQLTFADAISGDGRTIAGTGINPDGNQEAWVAILEPSLQAGDTDQDLDFDQLDLVKVQQSAKYLSGQPATWGDGDWDGAPGGFAGSPPTGDGIFNQLDIVAALASGLYLAGPYEASGPADLGDASLLNDAIIAGLLAEGGEVASIDLAYVSVPEPSGLVVLATGLVAMAAIVRFRFQNGSLTER